VKSRHSGAGENLAIQGKGGKAYVSLRENAVKHLDSRLRGNDEVFHVVAESAGFCAPQLEKDKSIRMLFVVCALRNISYSKIINFNAHQLV
jgi:hypothetical protein